MAKSVPFVWKAMAYTGVILWLLSLALYDRYTATRPRAADPVVGRIYALNNHGAVVYLNRAEEIGLYGSMFIATGIAGVGIYMALRSAGKI